MLTADLVKPRLRKRGAELLIDMIDPESNHWQHTAAEMIALFQASIGNTHEDWETALDTYQGERVDYVVIRGLAKVLSDAATFAPLDVGTAEPIDPVAVRERLFAYGPTFTRPDLFHQQTRQDAIRAVAKEFHTSQKRIERLLFADRPAEYSLTNAGLAWTPFDLLTRYNLELARGVLYWCPQMDIDIYDTYKDLWRYIKLFKLMFTAQPITDGYHVTLDGPISPFVAGTTRYGRQLAAFLPALFLCDHWRMEAAVKHPLTGELLKYRLDNASPLHSHFKRSGLFDSRLEADFAAEFEAKFGGVRGAWTLTREDELLLLGDTVMIPDFAVTHKGDGRRALIEIVGFWHPDYLRRKVEKVRAAQRGDLILLVYEGVNLAGQHLSLADVPGEVLYFINKPVLKDVIAAVERAAR